MLSCVSVFTIHPRASVLFSNSAKPPSRPLCCVGTLCLPGPSSNTGHLYEAVTPNFLKRKVRIGQFPVHFNATRGVSCIITRVTLGLPVARDFIKHRHRNGTTSHYCRWRSRQAPGAKYQRGRQTCPRWAAGSRALIDVGFNQVEYVNNQTDFRPK